MLIKALCDYYDILKQGNKLPPDGYSNVRIDYLISLTPDGKIDGTMDNRAAKEDPLAKSKGKNNLVGKKTVMFRRSEKSAVDSNIIEHRARFIFGLNYDNGRLTPEDKTDKAKKSHEDFVKTNLEFIEGIDTPVVTAYRNFLNSWVPKEQTENQILLSLGKAATSANFSFYLSGHPEIILHEDSLLKEKWDKYFVELLMKEDQSTQPAQCGIIGEELPISKIHRKIRYLKGGTFSVKTLISYDSNSGWSYGIENSYNSNISRLAMEKYTQALNFLTEDDDHKTVFEDLTVLHWAMSEDEKYEQVYNALNGEEAFSSEEIDKMLKSAFKGVKNGILTIDNLGEYDLNTDFYIVGLRPSGTRIAIKFIYKSHFGDLLKNIYQHRQDMQATEKSKAVSIWRIEKELLRPKKANKSKTPKNEDEAIASKKYEEKVDPALTDKIFKAIIFGYNYPDFLLAKMINRIKTDSDTKENKYIKINQIRIGVIKACINRKLRLSGQKEELTLALDLNNKTPAYLCGRLFAVLEKLQQKSSKTVLNRTIRDSYFSSAATTPAMVFPKLLMLSKSHLSKLDYPKAYHEKIGQIIALLGSEFPNTLSLVDQGKFIIGYYQQFYDSYSNEEKNTQEEN